MLLLMHRRYKKNMPIFIIAALFLLTACNSTNKEKDYTNSINDWHKKRHASLTKKTGWLSLAGLYWLQQGENTFGSDSLNQIIFPEKASQFMGSFFLDDTTVTVIINEGIEVLVDSSLISSMQLKNDNQKGTHILSHASLSWYIIKRTDKFGIRLKDSEHPNLKSFTGIDHFPIDQNWRIKAHLELHDSIKTIRVPNVLGQISDSPSPGALVFEIAGQTYKLDAMAKEKDDTYFLIFADETSGEETYGAGRFLYVDKVDDNGEIYIDFNKAYNPPCVFTPFATCPLPPLQNRLATRITAGEKSWEKNH
jgi:uncharacterized protein (DUF1684 family)